MLLVVDLETFDILTKDLFDNDLRGKNKQKKAIKFKLLCIKMLVCDFIAKGVAIKKMQQHFLGRTSEALSK